MNMLAVYGHAPPAPAPMLASPPAPPEADEGLVELCIMCQARPQGPTDHFCGRDCRKKAMQKP